MKTNKILLVGCGESAAMEIAIASLLAKHPNTIIVRIDQLEEAPKFTTEPFEIATSRIFDLKEVDHFEVKKENKPFYFSVLKKKNRRK